MAQVLDSRLVSVAADKVWVGSGVGAPVLDMAETVPPGTRWATGLDTHYRLQYTTLHSSNRFALEILEKTVQTGRFLKREELTFCVT